MKILLLGLLDEATGNATTLHRIGSHLKDDGHHVTLLPHQEIPEPSWLIQYCQKEQFAAALGLHAFGAGQHLRYLQIPTVIVFGGTDLNEDVRDPERLPIMTEAVIKAAKLIAFNRDFIERAKSLWPSCSKKILCIPQSTQITPSTFSLRTTLHLSSEDILFLLPSGLRQVKDPLFLIDTIARWHREDPHIHLVILGTKRDPVFAELVQKKVQGKPGILIIDPLSQSDLHAAMREADAVLNTSVSECSPNSILEAMALGVAVIARNIPGNRAIIENAQTGLLFNTKEEFQQKARILLSDTSLQQYLTSNAQNSIQEQHNIEDEKQAYQALFASIRSSCTIHT